MTRELQLLQNFLKSNKQEHFFKEEICKGLYLQAFKNQADKIRILLDRASKSIYHMKSKSIDAKCSNSFGKTQKLMKENTSPCLQSPKILSKKIFSLKKKPENLKVFFQESYETQAFITPIIAIKFSSPKRLENWIESPTNLRGFLKKLPKEV